MAPTNSTITRRRPGRLLACLEAIEALVRMDPVLRLPHVVPLEVEGLREGDGIGCRQDVVETAVVRIRNEALDRLDPIALRRALVIEVAGRNVIGLDHQR